MTSSTAVPKKKATVYPSIKIWPKTLETLRLTSALSGERMVEIIDRLASRELARQSRRHLAKKDKEAKANG